MNQGSCVCFSVCSAADVVNFVQQVPRTVDETSPWSEYLRVIYGNVSFPFDMSTLSFVYHNTMRWPSHIWWPMNTCKAPDGAKSSLLPVAHSFCPNGVCKGWKANTTLQSVHAAHGYPLAYKVVLFPTGDGTSIGFTFGGHGTTPHHRLLSDSYGYIEVIRGFSPYREGTDGYGCWYAGGAIGSGIYLNVGRTVTHCDKKGWKGALPSLTQDMNTHLEKLKGSFPATWFDSKHKGHLSRGNELITVHAWALGYDTVQCARGWNWGGLSEIIDIRSYCRNQSFPVLACPPPETDLRVGNRLNTADAPNQNGKGLRQKRSLPSLNCQWPS